MLMKKPSFTAIAVLTMALGVGANTALFSVVNAVILQPVSATRPGALVRLWIGNGNRISWWNLHDICDETPGVSCAGYRVDELMWQQRDETIREFQWVVANGKPESVACTSAPSTG